MINKMEKILTYFTMVSMLISVGVAIGLFQERLSEYGKSIDSLVTLTSSLDVMQSQVMNIDKRLNRLEFNTSGLASNGDLTSDLLVLR